MRRVARKRVWYQTIELEPVELGSFLVVVVVLLTLVEKTRSFLRIYDSELVLAVFQL